MNKLYWLLLFLLTSIFSFAQSEYNVSGRLIDNEKTLPLVNIFLYTSQGYSTRTNNEGYFQINIKALDTLIIAVAGYDKRAIPVDSLSHELGTIILSKSKNELEEVQVSTGYQQLPKERATGSFELINNKRLGEQPTTDILSRLEGTSSILFDKNGQRPSMTIRGFSSLTKSIMSPLVIVDNFPYEGDIDNINPNDVESVTLLKDAAASSIWGARAGNGVIVITTKKAKKEEPVSINFTSNTTWITKPDLYSIHQMSSADFIDMEQFLFNQGFYKSYETSTAKAPISPVVETLIAARDGKLSASDAAAAIDRYKTYDLRDQYGKLMYQNGIKGQYALNLQGGSKNLQYFLSGGFDQNKDNLSATYQRASINSNAVFKPLKNWELTGRIFYVGSNTKTGKTSLDQISGYSSSYPYLQIADANGNALPYGIYYRQAYVDTAGAGALLDWNYYPMTDYLHNYSQNDTKEVLINIGSKYQLFPFVSFDLGYQYENQGSDVSDTRDMDSYYTRDLINTFSQINRPTGVVTYQVPKGSIVNLQRDRITSHNGRAQLAINKNWGSNNLTAIAGGEIRQINTQSHSYNVYGYDDNTLTNANVDYVHSYPNFITGATSYIPSGVQFTDITNRYVSTFANSSFLFRNRYTLSASIRRDASNLFGVATNDKWTPLWSVGGSWNITNEPWNAPSWIQMLKLRATYGTSGNVNPGQAAITTLKYQPINDYSTNFSRAYVASYGNPDLRWEKVNTTNLGLDYSFLAGRINGSLDFYQKKATDLLGTAPLDYTTGIWSITKNVASMRGQGMDLALNIKILEGRLNWQTGILMSYYKSKILDYYLSSNNASNFVSGQLTITGMPGKPVYSVLSYPWAGLDNQGNPQGLINEQPSIDYSALTGSSTQYTDLVYNGSATPTVWGSMNHLFEWNGFSLSVNLIYKFGFYFRKPVINYTSLFSSYTYVENGDYAKRWQQPGDELKTNVPSMVYPASAGRDNFYRSSNLTALKGDEIRLQYITLQYQFKRNFLHFKAINGCSVYGNISNLGVIWRKNKEGLDPEYPNTLAPSKTITLGLRIQLNQ